MYVFFGLFKMAVIFNFNTAHNTTHQYDTMHNRLHVHRSSLAHLIPSLIHQVFTFMAI